MRRAWLFSHKGLAVQHRNENRGLAWIDGDYAGASGSPREPAPRGRDAANRGCDWLGPLRRRPLRRRSWAGSRREPGRLAEPAPPDEAGEEPPKAGMAAKPIILCLRPGGSFYRLHRVDPPVSGIGFPPQRRGWGKRHRRPRPRETLGMSPWKPGARPIVALPPAKLVAPRPRFAAAGYDPVTITRLFVTDLTPSTPAAT